VRIQIGQNSFAINNFNQTPSHPQRGRRELVGINTSHPVVNQGQNIQTSLSKFPQGMYFVLRRVFAPKV
jgi:hypothetical protein